MDSDKIMDIVEKLGSLSGSNAKKDYLKHMGSTELQVILNYTYDPFKRYYIKNLSAVGKGTGLIMIGTLVFLDRLARRELSGHEALRVMGQEIMTMTPKSGELLKRVINKDLRIGMGAKTINAVFPGTVPEHPVMLAKLFDKSRVRFPLYVSPKIDGVRAIYRNNKFYSRNGHEYKGLNHVIECLPKGIDIDGELVVPGLSFQESSGLIRSDDIVPVVRFHMLDLPSFINAPFYQRYKALNRLQLLFCEPVVHTVVDSIEQIFDYYKRHRKQGFEGTVVKPYNYMYQNKRSWDWMKLKDVLSEDLEVIDVFEGTGKYKDMLGGVIIRRANGKTVRVGSGFNDNQRAIFWRQPELIIGRIIEVLFHEETPDGSLRHPRFTIIRDDKE